MMLADALRLLDPERAHDAAIELARFAPGAGPGSAPARLRVRLAGLPLAHPIGLAAGFDKNARAVTGLLRLGFAFVEVGTVTPRPQAGNPRPRLFRLVEDRAVINRMGFNNIGAGAVAQRLARHRSTMGPVGVNIGMNRDAADPLEDYLAVMEAMLPVADYLSVNVSSPNTPGLRALQKAETLHRLLRHLVDRRDAFASAQAGRPLFVKVAPDLGPDEERAIADVVMDLRLDGLIVANTTVDRPASLTGAHAAEEGGLSGAPLFTRSTALVARFARLLQGAVPIIGVGGVRDAGGAYAKIRAGARAVQLYTALVYEGPGLVRRIVSGLDSLLAKDGFERVEDAIGVDTEHWIALDRRLQGS